MASRLLSSNIPLHCNICPKKPDFSDVSHLLTHIASKGHLSTYYKIKVIASSEDASRQIIEEYDTWYALWNIEDLMSERLNLKERRKSKSRNSTSLNAAPMPPYGPALAYPAFSGAGPYDHAVDPRLVPRPHRIKAEPLSRSTTPVHPSYMDTLAMHGFQHSYANPLAAWHPSPYMYMVPKQDQGDEHSSEASFMPGGGTTCKPNNDNVSIVGGEADGDDTQETSKLKGVYWPGMDMFDAAPLEQRRKRNQKKDTSVVKQLEAMSNMIEPTEQIFSPLGTHRRTRPISGLPDSDDNLLPGEESPPRPKKVKRTGLRKPLADKDVNTSRKKANKPQKRGRPSKAAVALKSRSDYPAEDGAAYSVPQKKRRKALQVYRDEDQDDMDKRITEMDTLTAAFHPSGNYQRADSQSLAGANARPSEPTLAPHQNYYHYPPGYQSGFHTGYQPAFYINPFNMDHLGGPNWDLYGHDASNTMMNPLFLDSDHGSIDDDQQTISIPDSEQ